MQLFLKINLFIYLFLAALGPRFCARTLSNCGKRGPLPAAALPAAEHRLQTRRPSSRGSRAQPPRSMWDPPGLGHEPASPALAGGLPTTAPPGKPATCFFHSVMYQTPSSVCAYRSTSFFLTVVLHPIE